MNLNYLKKVKELKLANAINLSSFKDAENMSKQAGVEIEQAHENIVEIEDLRAEAQESFDSGHAKLVEAYDILIEVKNTLDEMDLEYHPELLSAFMVYNGSVEQNNAIMEMGELSGVGNMLKFIED